MKQLLINSTDNSLDKKTLRNTKLDLPLDAYIFLLRFWHVAIHQLQYGDKYFLKKKPISLFDHSNYRKKCLLILFLNLFPILQVMVLSWAHTAILKKIGEFRENQKCSNIYDLTWAGFCQQESNENGIKPSQQRKLTNRSLTTAGLF